MKGRFFKDSQGIQQLYEYHNGWYSTLSLQRGGFLKADTLQGLINLFNKEIQEQINIYSRPWYLFDTDNETWEKKNNWRDEDESFAVHARD